VHAYSVYGLGLHSEFPIPELQVGGSGPPDVVVTRGSLEASRPPEHQQNEPDASWAERRADSETLCVFAGVGRYLIRGGQAVIVDPDVQVDFAAVRHLLLGPVLAHLLWQRGIFALHASVVGIAGRYLGFVGVSGEGKSTLAAALARAGHLLVCDDVAAIVEHGARVEVLPGFPRIRLHADSLRSLGEDPERLPAVHEYLDKRLKTAANFAPGGVLLDKLYVLETGTSLAAPALAPGAAIVEVLRHTYYAHQFAPLYGFKHHLERATALVQRVAAYRLVRPKDLAQLPELVAFVEAHAAA
jgi:hypothetical protein